MELIVKIIEVMTHIFGVMKEIIVLILHDLFPDGIVHLNWTHLTLAIMVFFGLVSRKKGWQFGLTTLASLFFAWAFTNEASAYLMEVVTAIIQQPLNSKVEFLFPVITYILLVLMVMVAFSNIISKEPKSKGEKRSTFLVGLLSGYFFVVLLLDLGREKIAQLFPSIDPLFNLKMRLDDLLFLRFKSDFTNNPHMAYEDLLTAESVILLLLLVVFWHRMVWSFLNWVDKKTISRK